jgi:hypothetical protein
MHFLWGGHASRQEAPGPERLRDSRNDSDRAASGGINIDARPSRTGGPVAE